MKKLLLVVSLALVSVQGAWAADKMLADRHVERGLKCESCHTTMPPALATTVIRNRFWLATNVTNSQISRFLNRSIILFSLVIGRKAKESRT